MTDDKSFSWSADADRQRFRDDSSSLHEDLRAGKSNGAMQRVQTKTTRLLDGQQVDDEHQRQYDCIRMGQTHHAAKSNASCVNTLLLKSGADQKPGLVTVTDSQCGGLRDTCTGRGEVCTDSEVCSVIVHSSPSADGRKDSSEWVNV